MSGALRSIFAEFGFDVDFATLDKLDGDLRAIAGALEAEAKKAESYAKATADAAKAAADKATRAAEEAAEAKKRASEVAKTGTKEEAEAAKKLAEEKAAAAKAAKDESKKASDIAKTAADASKAASNASKLASKDAEAAAKDLAAAQKEVADAVKGVAAALGLAALMDFAQTFAANAEALRDTARESRVTTSELQGLDHAAAQAGVGVERMRSGLHTFGEALRQGERWGNGTTMTLRRLGIQARDSSGHIRPTVDLMDEVAVALERVESPYRRARVAQHLFGESGRRMLDVLHSGPGGIRQLREELEELGGGVTPEAVEASRAFTQAQERQGRALDSVRSVLATSLLPALSWFMNLTARGAGELAKLTRGTHVTEIALGALGVAGAVAAGLVIAAWAPAVAPFVLAAAAVALVGLALDDVVGFMEGKESAVGRFLDTVFGEGTSTEAIEALRGAWQGVRDIFHDVEEALRKVNEGMDRAAAFAEPVTSRLRGFLGGTAVGSYGGVQVGAAPSAGAGVPVAAGGSAGASAQRVGAPVGATITVPASGFAGVERPARQVSTTHNHGPIIINGITDPDRVAAKVDEIQQRRAREQRDADHPQEDED